MSPVYDAIYASYLNQHIICHLFYDGHKSNICCVNKLETFCSYVYNHFISFSSELDIFIQLPPFRSGEKLFANRSVSGQAFRVSSGSPVLTK